MADDVKVFTHIGGQTSGGDVSLLTTDSTTKAVVKDVVFKGKTTHYPTQMSLKLNGNTIGETHTSKADTELNVGLSGSLIVDHNSELEINVPTPTREDNISKLNAIVFSNGVNWKTVDSNTNALTTQDTYSYTDVESSLTASNRMYDQNYSYSAFAVKRNGVVEYFRFYSNQLYRHTDAGPSPGSVISVPEASYSMCTDGTNIYEKSSNTSTTIRVYNVSDFAQQTSITTDVSYEGQGGNRGSFMLTRGGYIYTKRDAGSTTIYKTEISTGTTTTITVTSVGGYSGGAVITRGSDGVFYLVEKGTSGWYKINLATESVTSYTDNGNMSESTEYGNAAFEIAGGYVGVLDAANIVVIDVVNGTYARTSQSRYNLGYSPVSASCGDYTSVAALSISGNIEERPVDLNYSVYASGVEIT